MPSKKQTRSCELNAGSWFLEEFEVWLWGTAGSGVASTQRLHTVIFRAECVGMMRECVTCRILPKLWQELEDFRKCGLWLPWLR